jgi:hypothetical protein
MNFLNQHRPPKENKDLLSQETIKNLNPEQLKSIETISKTALA